MLNLLNLTILSFVVIQWGSLSCKLAQVGQLYNKVGQRLLQSRVALRYYKMGQELLESGAGNLLQRSVGQWPTAQCNRYQKEGQPYQKMGQISKNGAVTKRRAVHRPKVHVGDKQKNLLPSPIALICLLGLRTN